MARLCERLVGYDRFVGELSYRQLTELYRALRLYVNCFQPSMKLQSKQGEGKKVRCVYDPAKTPLQCLLLSGVLPAQKQQELIAAAHALDPIRLFEQLEQLQQAVFRCVVGVSPFVPNTPSAPIRVFSIERCAAGMPQASSGSVPDPPAVFHTLYQEQERRKRVLGWRRTHKDPFEGEWEQIMFWLTPTLNGAVAASSGRCSAAPPDAISRCKSAPSSAGCARSESTCWEPLRSSGKKK